MATILGLRRTDESGTVAVDATGVAFEWTPGVPIDILRWGFTATVAVTNAADTVVAQLIKRPTPKSATGQTVIDACTITGTTTRAAGYALYREIGTTAVAQTTEPDGSLYTVAPGGPVEINAGQQVVVNVSAAADAGDGVFWIEYLEKPFVGSRVASVVVGADGP